MSAERFFDDVARTLAEPMPRRRAVRVIGASLAVLAVPGVSPRLGRAATASRSQDTCPLDEACCYRTKSDGTFTTEHCGRPFQRYDCVNYKCHDQCPRGQSCASLAKHPSGPYAGRPLRWNCCPTPDMICDPSHVDLCLPNCQHLYKGKAVTQCGSFCCPPGQRCKNPKTGACAPCPKGTTVCGNQCCKSDALCSDCREQGSYAPERRGPASETGRTKCCAKDEKCCRDRCCKNSTHCCGSLCCDAKGSSGTYCASRGNRDICCPHDRVLRVSRLAICCPQGTWPVKGSCCPPGDPDCCPPRDGLGNVLNCASLGRICVNGACVKP